MFKSNQELFQATEELISIFEKNGQPMAAAELRSGLGALNGLTDGWASFLDSVHKVKQLHLSQLDASQQSTLKTIHKAAYRAVYRGSMGQWWKYW